jgi:hypothetical protein
MATIHLFRPAVLAMVLLQACGAASAALTDRTAGGIGFVEGGIGIDEVQALDEQRSRYPLALRMAALRSGAYLADVHLTITDAAGSVIFDRQLQAPWLLIELKPGRYELVGVCEGNVQRLVVVVPARGHREAVMYFAVPGEMSPRRVDADR